MILGGEKSTDQSVTQQVADYIIGHVSNSDQAHPILQLPSIFGIDMSVYDKQDIIPLRLQVLLRPLYSLLEIPSWLQMLAQNGLIPGPL